MPAMAKRDLRSPNWFNNWAARSDKTQRMDGLATATKKIEQDASGNCRKSEYLTLLNTFGNATTRDRQGAGEYYKR